MAKFLNEQGVAHLWAKILEKINSIVVDPVEIVSLTNSEIDAIIEGTYNGGGNSGGGDDLVG
ncbi:MAG: hypothetical protein J6V54_10710 [Bacteroidales bacterium]|nr:hypothetical protein [Bacteroidales bacterium]